MRRRAGARMQKHAGVGFVRIKPVQCEKSSAAEARRATCDGEDDELFDPLIAVKVLDAETIPGQRHVRPTSRNVDLLMTPARLALSVVYTCRVTSMYHIGHKPCIGLRCS